MEKLLVWGNVSMGTTRSGKKGSPLYMWDGGRVRWTRDSMHWLEFAGQRNTIFLIRSSFLRWFMPFGAMPARGGSTTHICEIEASRSVCKLRGQFGPPYHIIKDGATPERAQVLLGAARMKLSVGDVVREGVHPRVLYGDGKQI